MLRSYLSTRRVARAERAAGLGGRSHQPGDTSPVSITGQADSIAVIRVTDADVRSAMVSIGPLHQVDAAAHGAVGVVVQDERQRW